MKKKEIKKEHFYRYGADLPITISMRTQRSIEVPSVKQNYINVVLMGNISSLGVTIHLFLADED